MKACHTYILYSTINYRSNVYSLQTTYHSMGGPRKDFFVRNPVWNRNCDANCTPKRDNSSAADVCAEYLESCKTLEIKKN